MIIVDTSVWVQFFRRPVSPEGREVDALLAQGEVAMTGLVLAEILQGARDEEDFQKLANLMTALPFLQADQDTWARAGELSFQLRRLGRLTPLTDLLIAAIALEGDHQVFTLDDHFQHVPGLRLYAAKAE